MKSRYLKNFIKFSFPLPKVTYQPALLSLEQNAQMGQVNQIFDVPKQFELASVMYSIKNKSATVEWLGI